MNTVNLHSFTDVFQELHYCGLDSQCSIYNLTKFNLDGNKLLVAPHSGTIMRVGFQNVLPLSKPMSFTYIPADAEIMAIDSFNQSSGVPIIGIIFVKVSRQRRESSGKSLTSFFNVYSEVGSNNETHLYKHSQGCKTLELGFLPYQLYHTEIYNGDSTDTVFLISGGDEKIHLFKGNADDGDDAIISESFAEVDVENYFVEFSSLPGVVTRMQCRNLPGIERRLSVIGCKDGKVAVYLVDLFKNELLKTFIFEQDSMITSVQIFSLSSSDKICPKMSNVHVLVTSAFEEAFIARSAFELGFTSLTLLKGSDQADCILCSLVGDIDFDGEVEILLGSYGQKLLIYKMHKQGQRNLSMVLKPKHSQPSTKQRLRINSAVQLQSLLIPNDDKHFCSSSSVTSFPTFTSADCGASVKDRRLSFDVVGHVKVSNLNSIENETPQQDMISIKSVDQNQWQKNFEFILSTSRDFQDPVMGLDRVDLTSDSIDELVVMTMNGVHILQKSIDCMVNVFKEKVKANINNKVNSESSLTKAKNGKSSSNDDDDVSERSFISKYE